MYAVTGANGQLGQLVIQHLLTLTDADKIVALVRDVTKASALKELGVDVRQADYNKPETLNTALNGVEQLLLISGSEVGQRVPQHTAVVAAAKEQKVRSLVYTSLLHADRNPMILAQEHKATEQIIAESGLPSLILRNGWYTENFTQGLAGILASGTVIGVSNKGKIHSAARKDYAMAAANVLVNVEAHLGKVYELAGDTGFTLAELAATVAKLADKPIDYQQMSQQAYTDALIGFGLPEGFAAALADSDHYAEQGWLAETSSTLSTLIQGPTETLEQAVKSAL